MKILITGRDGLVGSNAQRLLNQRGDEVFAFSKADLDVTDVRSIERAINQSKPDALVNCAAYTDVDGAESNRKANALVNAEAPGLLAKACQVKGIRFVTISTDYVFDGSKDGFYVESDETKPLSQYGRAKLEGENNALRANSDSIVVRTGWVFGEGGANFLCQVPSLIQEKKDFFAIEDSFGTPTYAPDLVLKIRELIDTDAAGLFHLTNSGSGTSYAGFVDHCAALLGTQTSSYRKINASSLSRDAPRPVNSRLQSERLKEFSLEPLRDWKDALADFTKKDRRNAPV